MPNRQSVRTFVISIGFANIAENAAMLPDHVHMIIRRKFHGPLHTIRIRLWTDQRLYSYYYFERVDKDDMSTLSPGKAPLERGDKQRPRTGRNVPKERLTDAVEDC